MPARSSLVLLAALAGCDEPTPGAPLDAPVLDADIDAAPSPFGRCGNGVAQARLAYGRLVDAAPEGALIASPALALWPSDGAAAIALSGVPETAVVSGAYLYWPTASGVVERALSGAQREVAIAAPARLVRAPDGGVYVVSAASTIARIAPGGTATVVTTATSAITELAVGPDVVVWQDASAIHRRALSTGTESPLLADATARLLGLRADTFVVERHPGGASSVVVESYDLSTGASRGTQTWSDGPVLATTLGPAELYLSLDRRETTTGDQWCSIQPSLIALGTALPATLVTEPQRVIAASQMVYVQTAGEHGQTCCSGHGMFSCSVQSMEPQTVWCFQR